MLGIIEKVLKNGESSWYEEGSEINIFYGSVNNYPKWNTVYKFYKKIIAYSSKHKKN